MEIIEIKRINDELILILNNIIDFSKLYDQLEEKLNIIKEQHDSSLIYVNIELGYRDICSQDLFCLYELFLKDEKILIKSINYNSYKNENIEVYQGTIRGGETKYFINSAIVLGDINPNALVFVKDELYVVGKIKGKVIVRNKDGGVNAASFQNAYIKIFDSVNSNVNFTSSKFIKYNNLIDYVGGKVYV